MAASKKKILDFQQRLLLRDSRARTARERARIRQPRGIVTRVLSLHARQDFTRQPTSARVRMCFFSLEKIQALGNRGSELMFKMAQD